MTLECQIEFNNTYDDDNNQSKTLIFDAIDWATHAAALSQFCFCEDDFSTSCHCLYCAEALLSYVNENRTKYDEVYWEKHDLQCASIKRCLGQIRSRFA